MANPSDSNSSPLSALSLLIRQLPDPEGDAFLAQGLGGVSLEEENLFPPYVPHPRNTGMPTESSAVGGGADNPLDYAKIAKPEPFDRDINKIKKFLRQCELMFILKPKEFKEDRVKIIFTLSYMSKGMAADWAGIYIDAMLAEKGSGSGQRRTWDEHVVPWPPQGRLDKPMEVDMTKQHHPIICYKYQKPGHIARDCRSQINFNEMDWSEIRALVLKEEKGKGKAKENSFSVLSDVDGKGAESDMFVHDSEIKKSVDQTPIAKTEKEVLKHVRSMGMEDGLEKMKIELKTVDTGAVLMVDALLDSGVTDLYVDSAFVKGNLLNTRRLPNPILVYNIDRTKNSDGSIKEVIDFIMKVNDHTKRATFAITILGRKAVIVGKSWLSLHNLEIDWKTGNIEFTRCPTQCLQEVDDDDDSDRDTFVKVESDQETFVEDIPDEEQLEEGDHVLFILVDSRHAINATESKATKMAFEASKKQKQTSFEDILRGPYKDFSDIFSKEDFDELPPRKKWDHAIELMEDWKPFPSKIYPLSQDKQGHLDEFIEEHIKSGHIRPSKSPMASPFFFVKKKDGKLRHEQGHLDEFIEEHIKSGHIRPSKSPMASPFFFVKKKDGKLRPV
ncbi:hypothetical protein EW146_g6811 [Bondarzewia mesenterica]|uniref:CCHC-type domain-containing protein n=1 Tax=Bondarzewia mesenterica TaxID=1095465 RepID=A0A4S4LMN8_9AGAM|nr:hypothetical protein EW146_g6811 [Bondarzewia mesenterica]